ncbi:hypothetical protein HQO42_14830 [Rhodococcus fascians]|nr:hypothetical protein [Rhodococcus fascians]MBY4237730.1 hypothetical protein [Rhodococcus fascians]MBY4253933.1 hypothetical protein [Rhodococcus fascians]MBY4269196.1 hypothetical protein [Rhodococcus fascians]
MDALNLAEQARRLADAIGGVPDDARPANIEKAADWAVENIEAIAILLESAGSANAEIGRLNPLAYNGSKRPYVEIAEGLQRRVHGYEDEVPVLVDRIGLLESAVNKIGGVIDDPEGWGWSDESGMLESIGNIVESTGRKVIWGE